MSQRVIHGDCTSVMRDLARDGLLVDSVVTDPPYHFASIVERLGSPDAAPIQSGQTGAYARDSKGFMGQEWDGGDVSDLLAAKVEAFPTNHGDQMDMFA